MIQLAKGINRIRWTGARQPIASVPWLNLIQVAYSTNYITGDGTLSYQPNDALSNMTLFVPGADYLVIMLAPYLLMDAVASPANSFPTFPASAVSTPDTAPTAPVGRTETGIAAEPITGGRLVAQTEDGLVHYSSDKPEHEHYMFGIALNSALPGGSVSVRRPGFVQYEGWGLPPNTVLLAGPDGRLVTEVPASSFCQLIGRSLDSDTLIYQPEPVVFLSNPQKTL